jgi:hypothetical protein
VATAKGCGASAKPAREVWQLVDLGRTSDAERQQRCNTTIMGRPGNISLQQGRHLVIMGREVSMKKSVRQSLIGITLIFAVACEARAESKS